ncbi:MAG: ParA family protein [Spirochaetaceae bacterium]|jgi:chromosome partitioning protein|nr:ParA family protein [Spirochaetaceae bacterium]
MGKTFVFVNQKGGVGKTTSAINLGAYFAEHGKSVLLIDFDSQANLTSGVGVKPEKNGVYEVLAGILPVQKAIRKTVCSNLFVLPASIDLSGATVELIGEEKSDFFLREAISPIRAEYDYMLIDCPPSLGVLTINGLVAADSVLIPMQCEYFALEGLTLLLQTIQRIKSNQNPGLAIEGIFFTMFDQRTRLAQQVVRQVGVYFKDNVYSTIIPRNVRLSEAPSHGLPISRYDPSCAGAIAYKSLCKEILSKI